MIRSMQSAPVTVNAPGKNAGKNKKKRANKKKCAAKMSGSTTMTSQLGAGRATVPQWCKIDIDQVANHAGGFVWKLTDLEHARRYLIMGAKNNGNCYQTSEQVSTECNTSILRVIRSESPNDFKQLCAMIEDISVRGLAARQEPTLLTLAAAIVFAPTLEKKTAALALVPKCVRIPTHAFMLAGYVKDLSQCKPGKEKGNGWGSGFRKALGQYYTSRRGIELATALTKYKNREGWRHEDLLRMLHVNPAELMDDGARLVFKYVFACTRGNKEFICKLLANIAASKTHEQAMQLLDTPIPTANAKKANATVKTNATVKSVTTTSPVSRDLIDTAVYLRAIMEIEACTTSVSDLYKALRLVRDHGLVREQIPTHLLNSSDIWTELLNSKGANGKQAGMPLEALIRNLGKLSSLPSHRNMEVICARLSSEEDIQKSRIHPFKVLVASRIYGMGKALKGALSWTVSPRVHDQLTTTFLRSFKNVTPTGKRYMAALDVSGSMDVPCMGCPAISCRQASAALAHMLYETEHNGNGHIYVRGFTAAYPSMGDNGFRNFDPLLRRGMTLDQFIQATNSPYGPTDCSLPILRAIDNNLNVDVFIVMTDSETFAGTVHPQVALEKYRKHANKPDAKLIVVGMTANTLTIADPNDRNTLNLAGFDASTPEIIAMFVRGEL